jgi:TIR domain
MMPSQNLRKGVFVSYSHKDKNWLDRLRTVLKPVLSGEAIWDDTQIRAGAKWVDEIEGAIAAARVAVLLVTPDFLASDFIVSRELPRILERQTKEGLTILWVAVKPAMYRETILANFQAANDPGRPLSTLKKSDQDKELVRIAERIIDAVNVNAVANVLRIIDKFEPQAQAFVEGKESPTTEVQHRIVAHQEPGQAKITVGHEVITGEDLAKLDSRSRQLIRALETAMNDLFDRWIELEPKRSARDPEIKENARKESEEVRQDICDRLNQIFNYLGYMGKRLEDHYHHVRFICQQTAKLN